MMENAALNTISSNQRSVNRNMETSVNETHNHGRILFCCITVMCIKQVLCKQ